MLNDPNDTARDDYDPAKDATDWVLSSSDSMERGEDGCGEDAGPIHTDADGREVSHG